MSVEDVDIKQVVVSGVDNLPTGPVEFVRHLYAVCVPVRPVDSLGVDSNAERVS